MASPFRQWRLPVLIFSVTLAVHYIWIGLFPEQDPDQSGWALLPVEASWLELYLEGQHYWLGYSYALSLGFVCYAMGHYWWSSCKTTGRVALGGLGFSGALLLAGCFLIGCCGSPMLIVWLNLFGAAFLPFAKPLIALLSTVSILATWLWIQSKKSANPAGKEGCC